MSAVAILCLGLFCLGCPAALFAMIAVMGSSAFSQAERDSYIWRRHE